MKKTVIAILVLMFSAILASASVLLTDTFSYADGPLVTAPGSPWTTYSGTITGQVSVISGRILLNKANGEDVHAPLAGAPYNPTSNTVLYASFKVTYTNLPASGGSYFAIFKDNSLNFRARVFAQTAGAAAGNFRLGIGNAGTAPSAVLATDLQTNVEYTIVVRYSVSNVVGTLWVNPAAETNASVTAVDAASTLAITSFGFREDGSGGTIGTLFVDDLRVGTSFADVVTNAPQIDPPVITSSPLNQAAIAGTTALLSVTATGTAPLIYQWQYSPSYDIAVAGTNLPGATNATLALSNVSFAQAGSYRVVVTNAVSSASGGPALLSVWSAAAPSLSLLTYNLHGNGTTNWSTNTAHVQAIGRQVQFLDPDVMTFQEIPVTNNGTAQMTNFVTAFRPGFFLATNSVSDGFIRSVILSRYPIVSSRSRLHASDLTPFGYTTSGFTRDLFEAEIAVPGWPQTLHVFTVHLKSGTSSADDAAKRAAEAGAVSNYFTIGFLTTNSLHPYLLTGDMNEDINSPANGSQQPIQRLVSAPTGLQLTMPFNPTNRSELTFSIQNPPPDTHFDYVLPCELLDSNVVFSQVFRTDLLASPPPPLLTTDDSTASDHLPVMMVFGNPYDKPFQFLALTRSEPAVTLTWQSVPGQPYRLDVSPDLFTWSALASNLLATNGTFTFGTNVAGSRNYFRVHRGP